MSDPLLPFIEIGSSDASVSIIWLHGLGADGFDFEPVIPQLNLPGSANIRFILPHAPSRAVTINGGMQMPAWYDILHATNIDEQQDETGIRHSAKQLDALIENEHRRGVPYHKIFLVGFSQGGVIALHCGIRFAHSLGGIVVLSSYLALHQTVHNEKHTANYAIAILLTHGTHDPVIPINLGKQTLQRLREAGFNPDWHEYDMQHTVIAQEIENISHWLQACIG